MEPIIYLSDTGKSGTESTGGANIVDYNSSGPISPQVQLADQELDMQRRFEDANSFVTGHILTMVSEILQR